MRTDLRNTVEAITTAARQLSSVNPEDHQGLSVAIQAFNQAMGQLYRLSGDRLRPAADSVNAVSTERVAVGEPYVRDVRRARFSEELDQALQHDAERTTPEPVDSAGRTTRLLLGYDQPDEDIRSTAVSEPYLRRRENPTDTTPRVDPWDRGRQI